jgi:hypothetical protein
MKFNTNQILKYPPATVWAAMRDQMHAIVASQNDMDYVRIDQRIQKTPKILHILSTWKADPPLPAFLKSFIKPDMLVWNDDALWDNEKHICDFKIKTHYQVEDIYCTGHITLEAMAGGKSTRIHYSGELTIKKTPRSSIFMTGLVIRGIESVASTLIENNFSKVVKGLGEAIKEQR